MNALIGEAGRRPDSSKTLETAGGHTNLLLQLPSSALLRRLSCVEPAGGDLEQRASGRVAVLPDEKHGGIGAFWIRGERNHCCGPRVAQHLHLAPRTVGVLH